MSEESKSWYRMTRPLFNSGFEDDEFWAYGQDGFQEVLDSFIGSDVLIYGDRTGGYLCYGRHLPVPVQDLPH